MKKKLILLDAHALLHRGYHAMPGFATYDGRPTGALFGFIKMILKIKDELKPDYVVACFDRKEATFRHVAYENYKAGRAKSDDTLVTQIIEAPRVCEALNIPVYSYAGFEADDLLGTIVEDLKKKNFKIGDEDLEVFIASGDMDTMQLIDKGNNVKVYTLKKGMGETIVYKYEDIIKRYGFTPEQIPDYKGLKGDSSDNIIGIKGIGDKTATILINLFDSIEKMYEIIHSDINKFTKLCKENKITERVKSLIIEGEEDAIFSKTLATIRMDVPVNFEIPKKSWLDGFNDQKFSDLCTEFEFRSFKNVFRKQVPKVNNLEVNSKNNTSLKELNIGGLDLDEDNLTEGFEIEVPTVNEEDFLELKVMMNLVESEMTNPDLEMILNRTNTESAKEAKEKLVEILTKESLIDLYLKLEKPIIGILKEMKEVGIKLDKEILAEQSILLTKKLRELEKDIFEKAKEEFNISSPKQLGYILYEKLKLGEKIKKTSTGAFSTNASQLDKLKDSNPIVAEILEYRKLSKLLSTYIDTLPNYILEDGRIHSTFVQTGTTTGRFSSENPNLQNLPAKGEDGLSVRKSFIVEDGFNFVSVDYSQIDLRSVAILSGDPNLLEIFKAGTDVHTGVAARVFKIDEKDVTSDMRRKAKTINFGILYGMGVTALKDSMQVSRAEAQEFYDEYKKTFKVMIDFLEKVKAKATRIGYTETLFKRRREIPLLKSTLPFLKAQGERIAINAPVQGTTADILKLAMLDISEYIKTNNLENDLRMLLQIHDELIFEIKSEIAEDQSIKLKTIFENVLLKRINDKDWSKMILENNFIKEVSLKAEVSSGKNLYELK